MSDTIEQVKEVADKTVTDKLNESLIRVIEGMEDGVAFLGAELPEFINQLLMWNLAENLIKSVLGLVILIAIIPYLSFIWRLVDKMHDTDAVFTKVFGGGLGVATLAGISLSLLNLTWLQIWIAPKVWLVEYATTLVK